MIVKPTIALFLSSNKDAEAVILFSLNKENETKFRQLANNIPDYDENGKHFEKCITLILQAAIEKYQPKQ